MAATIASSRWIAFRDQSIVFAIGQALGVSAKLLERPRERHRRTATCIGFAPATIVDWAEAGKVPVFKVGGRLRFRLSEVEVWLEDHRQVRLTREGHSNSVLNVNVS